MKEKFRMEIARRRAANILGVLASFDLSPYRCNYTYVNNDVLFSFYLHVTFLSSVEFNSLLHIDKVEFTGLMPFGLNTLRFTFKVFTDEKKK